MNKNSDERIGEWAAIGHLILDGFWPVATVYGVRFLPPIELLGLVTFISGFFFLFVGWKRRELGKLLHRKTFRGCLLYISCILLPYIAIFNAAKYTSSGNVALLTQSEVVFATLVGYFLLKEKLQLNRIFGVFCVFLANLVVLYRGSLNLQWADLVLVLCPMVFVFGNVIAKRLQMQGLGYAPLLFFRGVIGGSILLLLSIVFEDFVLPDFSLWFFLLGFSFFAFTLPKAFWQIALQKIDLSKTVALGLSYPAFSFLFAYFWLGEIPTVYHWIGLLISFVGIFFLMQSTSRHAAELMSPTD